MVQNPSHKNQYMQCDSQDLTKYLATCFLLQVDGQPVVAGEDSVPITIRLKQHASSTEIVHDFPKNLRLASFHKQVSQLTGVPDAQLHLQLPKVRDGGDACSSSDAWGDDDTLESHQLTNNSAVIFSDSLGSTSDHSQ